MFEAAVEISREWDAYTAGQEVATKVLAKMTQKPKFVLLFATIHYEKNGGFKKLLEGVYSKLPEDVPLVGGTYAGFSNNDGTYTRGVAGVTIYSDDMEVSVGVGRNTKRSPQSAGKQCANLLMEWYNKSTGKNKVILNFISGVTMPRAPGMNRIVVLTNNILARFSILLLQVSSLVFQKGIAREEEVLEELKQDLGGDVAIFGGSTVDNNVFSRSYEFKNKEVFSNSIVGLGISTNRDLYFGAGTGFVKSGLHFDKVQTRAWGRMIRWMDGKPAVSAYLDALGWSRGLVDEKMFHRRFIFNPLGYENDEGKICPTVPGAFLGNNYVSGGPVLSQRLYLLRANGADLLNAVDEATAKMDGRYSFALVTSCASRLETLGTQENTVREKLKNKINAPFLILYTTGENYCLPKGKINNLMVTFNLFALRG